MPRSRKGKSDLFKTAALLPRCCFCFGARRSRSGSFAALLFAAGWTGMVFSLSFRRASVSFAVGAHSTGEQGHSGFCRGKGGLCLSARPERAAPRRDQGIGLPAGFGNASGNDGGSIFFAVGAASAGDYRHSGFCRGKGGLRLSALPERAAPRRDGAIGLPAGFGNAFGNDGASAVFRPIGRADGPGFAGHGPVGSGGADRCRRL